MLWILIVVTCFEISTLASAQSKRTTSFNANDANSDEPDHPSEYINESRYLLLLTNSIILCKPDFKNQQLKLEASNSSAKVLLTSYNVVVNKIRVKLIIELLVAWFAYIPVKDQRKKHTWLFELRIALLWLLRAAIEHWQQLFVKRKLSTRETWVLSRDSLKNVMIV